MGRSATFALSGLRRVLIVLALAWAALGGAVPIRAEDKLIETTTAPTSAQFVPVFSGSAAQMFAAGLTGLDQPIYALEGRAVVRMNMVGGRVSRVPLAELPVGESDARLALWNGDLLVVGSSIHRLDSAGKWIRLAAVPDAVRGRAVIAVTPAFIYLLAPGAAFKFSPADGIFTAISAPGAIDPAASASALGAAHLAVFSPNEPGGAIALYHTVTDRWFAGPVMAMPQGPLLTFAGDGRFELISASMTLRGEAVLARSGMSMLDYGIVIALFAVLIGIGLWSSRRAKQSSGDFFRASRSIPWWAAALSLFATGSSAITIMSMPAMAFTGNWVYFSIGLFLIVIMVPLFTFVYVPILRRLNLASANEYLEHRFGLSVRLLGFASFSLYQILGRVAAILLLPAIAINSITGIPIIHSILLMGLVTTFVVAIGGFAAVIWTDVVLAALMVLAVGFSLYFAINALEIAPAEAWALIETRGKLQLFDWRLDWGAPVVTVLFLNCLATALGYVGDQNFLQRVQCTPTKAGATSAAVGQLFVAVPLNFVLFSFGTILFLFYYTRPDLLSPAMKPDGIYPYYAATSLPAGLGGLVAVALLAATVSTVSSALNSVSNLGVEDIYRRFRPDVNDDSCVRLGRWLTIALGVSGTLLALLLANLSALQSVWDLFLMVMGLIVGPVTGIFVLGIFTRSANTPGVWIGAIGSLIANGMATYALKLHSTAFLSIGVFSCIAIGYLASLALGGNRGRDISGLTVFSQDPLDPQPQVQT